VVDYGAIAVALESDIVAAGGSIALGREVTGIRECVSDVLVTTKLGPVRARHVVIAAGLQADRLSRASGGDDEPRILPFRGEYFTLRPDRAHLVRGLIYPVPDPRYPFLGVHFTRRLSGKVDVGPNAVLALSREGYRRRDIDLRDVREMALWPGSWRLARSNWRAGFDEIIGSASKRAFVHRARSFVPELRGADLEPAPSGVRAQAVRRDGSLVDDFVLARHGRVFSVRNAPSPAATASLAIAEHIAGVLLAG
jgi:L-2-hydroxyglutarate oxidase LhgO